MSQQSRLDTAYTVVYFKLLLTDSQLFNRLRKEIDAVVGSKSEIEFQNLADLKYTGAVIKESLRLYPPAPLLYRSNSQEIKTDKFVIPKDSIIIVSSS